MSFKTVISLKILVLAVFVGTPVYAELSQVQRASLETLAESCGKTMTVLDYYYNDHNYELAEIKMLKQLKIHTDADEHDLWIFRQHFSKGKNIAERAVNSGKINEALKSYKNSTSEARDEIWKMCTTF